FPRLGSSLFTRIERAFTPLARNKRLSIVVVGLTALLLRLATLPLNPVPHPFIHDDFSFLLAAHTFASGRLTNPTPAMWTHFETVHETMVPTYMSMYFPAQGLVLAAGIVLTGLAWSGILVVTALMCAALVWMLQAWLPPKWALLGGIIAIVHIALFSYWINTYSGGGSVAALGGALVLGALPRLMRTAKFRYGLLLAIGIILLATSRPYEGLLLCLPVAFVLGRWIFFGKNTPPAGVLLRRAAVPLLLILAAGAWMGYYNYRVFGSPTTLPYKIDRTTYAVTPYFIWQPLRPEPHYRHKLMQEFYTQDETPNYETVHSIRGFVPGTLGKALIAFLFFAGIAMLPPLIMVRRVFLDRRIRFLIACVLVLSVGMAIEIYLAPQYIAPFTAAFYAIGIQAIRHLRLWKPGDQPVGKTMARVLVSLCVVLAVVRLYAQPLHIRLGDRDSAACLINWYGPSEFGLARAKVEAHLESLPGNQLAIVHYAPGHSPVDEWVYNAPDIGHSKVIWAQDMGAEQNLDLIHYYKNRTVWLIQPDSPSSEVTPYPVPDQLAASLK
ncbi:MAG: hypothetical protein ACRD3F_06845, partial [Acidobacteriaceae bacterium]